MKLGTYYLYCNEGQNMLKLIRDTSSVYSFLCTEYEFDEIDICFYKASLVEANEHNKIWTDNIKEVCL